MEELGGEKKTEELSITVEAKTFTCSCLNGMISLKEIHRKGQRELKLSLNQANWISKGLLQRSRDFGLTRRREAQAIDGKFVSLIEGSNKRGCFLSIQTKQGRTEPSFLVVPAGKNGLQWRILAKLLSDGAKGRLDSACIEEAVVPGTSYGSLERSYAQAVVGGASGSFKKLSYSLVTAIEARITTIETELIELRRLLQKEGDSGFVEKMNGNREILLDPTVATDGQRITCESGTRGDLLEARTGTLADTTAENTLTQCTLVDNTTDIALTHMGQYAATLNAEGACEENACLLDSCNDHVMGITVAADRTARAEYTAENTANRADSTQQDLTPAQNAPEITSTAGMSDSEASKAGVSELAALTCTREQTVAERTMCTLRDSTVEADEREELNAIAGERSGDEYLTEAHEYLTEAQKDLTKDRTAPEKLGGNHVAIMQVDPTALRSGNLGVSAHTVEIEAINAPEQAVNALTYGDQATTGIVGNRVDDDLTAEIEPNPTVEINDSFSVAIGALDAEILAENVAERMADPNIESVIWDDIEGAFVHLASGLRYWPKRDTYFSYVSHKEGKERGVFYNLVDGVPVLCQEGILGESNEITFEEQDWDRNAIFTEESEGYHPDLENFFRARIDRGKNEN